MNPDDNAGDVYNCDDDEPPDEKKDLLVEHVDLEDTLDRVCVVSHCWLNN